MRKQNQDQKSSSEVRKGKIFKSTTSWNSNIHFNNSHNISMEATLNLPSHYQFYLQTNFHINNNNTNNINNNNNNINANNISTKHNNNNNNTNININNNNNKNNEIDVYIISSPKSKRITFNSIEEVEEYFSNFDHSLTNQNLLEIIANRKSKKDYFINLLFQSVIDRKNEFGSFFFNNRIFIMKKDEFDKLKEKTKSQNEDSIKRKIKECLSEPSSLFQYQKLYGKSANLVIQFLDNQNYFINNNNNNLNNNNKKNKNKIHNNNNKHKNKNNKNNNLNNDNNNNNTNGDLNNLEKSESLITQNEKNFSSLDDEDDNYNDINDRMEIEELIPKQPSINFPFDPFDQFSIGEKGEGFDGEILKINITKEMLNCEYFYSHYLST